MRAKYDLILLIVLEMGLNDDYLRHMDLNAKKIKLPQVDCGSTSLLFVSGLCSICPSEKEIKEWIDFS